MSDAPADPSSPAAFPVAGADGASAVAPSPVPSAVAPTAVVPSTSNRGDGTRPLWARLESPFTIGFLLTLGGLAALLLGLALSNLSTVLIYIIFAIFASLGLDPLVKWFERHNVKRAWGVTIVFFVFAVVLVGILWLIVPTLIAQVGQFVSDIPSLITGFEQSDLFHWLEGFFGAGLETLVNDIQTFLQNPANLAAITGGALKIGFGIATGISGLIIVLVLTLYFVASLPSIKVAFLRLAPARNRHKVRSMTDEITDSVGGYLMGMVVLAFLNSVVAFILHLSLQLPFPLLMAVIAFCITIIPLVGPVLYWIIATVLALFTSPLSALIFALIYLTYMQLEAYVLTPRVMNRTISIPGSLVVIGALVGGTLLGLLGALVAIPVTASILLIIKQVWIPKQDAKT